jgi:4-amino-4-deoxy-L-arabinose transferase-like glycosyltransferase
MPAQVAPRAVGTGVVVFLFGTLCALLVALFVYRSQSIVATTIDLNGFGLLSRNLAAGQGFTFGEGPTVRRAPLYPLLGAALLKGFGSPAAPRDDTTFYRPLIVGNCVLFGLTGLTVWATTRHLFGSRAALLAVLLCPIVPQTLRYVGMTEVETLMGLLLALLAYTGINLAERPRVSTGLWFGLTAAAATLAKPVTILYPFFFVLESLWYSRAARGGDRRALPFRARLVPLLAALISFVLLLVPWALRNLAVTGGQFAGISSNAPGEFLRGYINAQPKYYLLRQDFGGTDLTPQKWDPEANDYEARFLGQHGVQFFRSRHPDIPDWQLEDQKDRIELAEVKRRLLHEPVDFLRKFVIQLATFWYIVETRGRSLLVGAVALVFLVLAVLGVVQARRLGVVTWPVVSIIVYVNAFYAAILAFARYSMPLYPTLLILAAGGLDHLLFPAKIGRPMALDPSRLPAGRKYLDE